MDLWEDPDKAGDVGPLCFDESSLLVEAALSALSEEISQALPEDAVWPPLRCWLEDSADSPQDGPASPLCFWMCCQLSSGPSGSQKMRHKV